MLKSEKYLSSLLPNFEEKRITSLIQTTREEYQDTILPFYEKTVKAFSATKMPYPAFLERPAKDGCPRFRGDLIAALQPILAKVPSKLALCDELVKEHFSTHVTKEGMTFAKMNVLRFVEVLNFSGMYARRLLVTLYASLNANDIEFSEKVMKREMQWLDANARGFFKSLQLLDMRDADLKSKFKSIPHLNMIQGEVEVIEDSISAEKLDPAKLGLIPHRWNPIFHLRVIWENWMEARRQATHEEVRQLELFLLLQDDTKSDSPKLKREIVYAQERLEKARRKLKKMEEDAEDEDM